MAGTEQETLTVNQIPIHTHQMLASTAIGAANTLSGNVTSQSVSIKMYIAEGPTASMNPNAVSPVGGSQPHENCQPFLCINYIISLFGIFPSQT
jgi:microcystin-dependent protein